MLNSVHWFFKSGIYDAAWMQAVTSLMLVFLTIATLLVLFVYARDTHKLANASIEQVRNAQMPFLALVKAEKETPPIAMRMTSLAPSTFMAWAVQNQGNAAAVNIEVSGECDGRSTKGSGEFSESLNPIPAGASTFIAIPQAAHITRCTIEYSSLDERRFCTEVTRVEDEQRVTFRRR